MPELPLPVDYKVYYRRLFHKFRKDLFKLGSGQVIGALLTIAILALQLYYGVIPRTLTLQAIASVGWPYLVIVIGLCLLSALRAPAQIDADCQREVKLLSAELELPDKDQAEYLRGLVSKLSNNGKAILRFSLLHDEVSKNQLKTVLDSWEDVQKGYIECLDLGLLRWRNDCSDATSPMIGSYDVYFIPEIFRIPLKRILHSNLAS